MKRETGNNIAFDGSKVSIQLPLGGHSFSLSVLTDEMTSPRIERVECTVLTPRTTLVPRECFDASSADRYLRVAGLPCRGGETVVTSDESAQSVAVMAIAEATLAALRERFGSRLTFTSPLCGSQNYSEPTVWLYRRDNLIYIKVSKTVLRLAEAVEISSESDVLQLLHDLEPLHGVRECTIVCCGDGCERLRKRLSKYYANVKCE